MARSRVSLRLLGTRPFLAAALTFAGAAPFAGAATLPGCAADPPNLNVDPEGRPVGPDWNASVDHVALTIDLTKRGATISPAIYGFNGVRDPARYGVASLRAGGNRYTAYNWENNASNAGRDFMFQNDGFLVMGSATPDAPGQAVRPLLETARALGATAIITVPNVDYVARDKLGDGDVTVSGDYLTTRFNRNLPTRGAPPGAAVVPDVGDDVVYQDEMVAWAKENFGDVAVAFSMDNEPDLWSATHREVHPDKATYEELVQRNRDYAAAVKAVWPAAPVMGFVSYGYQGYLSLNNAPDSNKGNFVSYYLAQMKAAEQQAGQRLVDFLDLHWYPEAQGMGASGYVRIVFGGTDNSPGVVEARVQAPRSLWELSYVEHSWIGGPIALIPRLRKQIADGYPGTKLAFTEWNYGGGGDASGAVATADVLGIFGREGVEAANIWPSGPTTFTLAAVAAYRNYDGAGAHFGDVSVSALTTSMTSSSVYASVESADPTRVVIVAINKRTVPTTATVTVKGGGPYSDAAVWVLTGTNPAVTPAPALLPAADGTFELQMPPLSVNVLVPLI